MSQKSNEEITKAYLDAITRRGYSANTAATYRRILNDYLDWLGAHDIHICKITRHDLDTFQVFLAKGPRKMPLSPGRRSLYVSVLRSFYRYAQSSHLVDPEIIAWLQYPLQPKRIRQDILTLDETNALLHAAADKGGWQHIAVRFMLLSGLRAGEVASLVIGDVAMQQREIVIRQSKGSKHRLVFFDVATKKHLKSYLAARRSENSLSRLAPNTPLLANHGVQRNTDQIYSAVKRLAKRAGITKNISPHSLRRTFATRLLDSGSKGMNLKVVSELLGHSSLRTTAKYAQVDERSLARIYHQTHPARNESLLP